MDPERSRISSRFTVRTGAVSWAVGAATAGLGKKKTARDGVAAMIRKSSKSVNARRVQPRECAGDRIASPLLNRLCGTSIGGHDGA
jgi:hypothetical protein